MTLHPSIEAFQTSEDELLVGGIPLSRLAERVGSTPFFAYDRALITSRVSALRRILPSGLSLSYAVKANPMPAVVQHLLGLGDAFDVASAFEMKLALDAGRPADRISFAGPGKTDAELVQAVATGVTVEMESPNEAARLVTIGNRLGIRPRVAVRVNPDFQVKGSGMRMGGGPQQFGIDVEDVPALLRTAQFQELDFLGFHVFAGSQNLHADILCQALEKNVALLLDLAQKSHAPIRYLNLGGGFGIPYFEKDIPLDIGRSARRCTT